MPYAKLLSPIQIGPITSKNRILLPAMELNYSMDGTVNQKHQDFYAERARGGAGLCVVGGCTIDRWAGSRHMLSLKDDSCIEGMKQLTEAVHQAGGLIGAQLYAAGAYAHSMLSGEQAISASPHTSRFTKEACREMTLDEIQQVVDNFAQAARRAESAGFDLVEISGSAGYLICQFLSPKINKREDDYGGPIENRMRFGQEVCQAVRAILQKKTALAIRIAGNDYVPESHTNQESCQFAAAVAPHVDMINVTGGWHETRVPQLPADVPRGAFVYLAREIRRQVNIPVAASNRLGNPQLAEQILQNGSADIVCMARPLIADPELPNKVARAEVDDIVPCTACNQGCFDPIFKLQPVGCMVNPRAGKEGKIQVTPSPKRRSVVVIGGGVAGATAAIVAAQRGHRVTLCEQLDHLGGQVAWAWRPTHKPEFVELLAYQQRALKAAGVDIRLNTQATAQLVSELGAEIAIVATGAEPITPDIPGFAQDKRVLQAWNVLKDRSLAGERVVVVGGGSVGCETALWLAAEGTLTPEQLAFLMFYDAETEEVLKRLQRRGLRQVTVVEQQSKLCPDLGSRRWIVIDALHKRGIKTLKKTQVLALEAEGLRINTASGEQVLPCDTVVMAVGAHPMDTLSTVFQAAEGLQVHTIGDCKKVQKIPEAIASGFHAANNIQ